MTDQDPREIAVDVLMELWERTEQEWFKGEIGNVRDALIEWLEEDPERWMIG